MYQVRIHGRGGQGAVTAAELLSLAAFSEGKHAQAFPSFGSERTGAPVMAFCRISEREIRLREPIVEPDALIIMDVTLLSGPNHGGVLSGLKSHGAVLLNTALAVEQLPIRQLLAEYPHWQLMSVPASEIAMQHVGAALPNAALLGAFAAMTSIIALESLQEALGEKFRPDIAEKNSRAAQVAFDHVSGQMRAHRPVHGLADASLHAVDAKPHAAVGNASPGSSSGGVSHAHAD